MTLTSEQDRVFVYPDAYHGYKSYRGPNPASDPAICGLAIIDDLEQPDLSYEYNTIIAWRDLATGKVYIAADSGCSCPTPFEQIAKLSDLTLVVNTLDAQAFVRGENHERYNGEPAFPLRDVMRFLSKIDAALRGEALAAA